MFTTLRVSLLVACIGTAAGCTDSTTTSEDLAGQAAWVPPVTGAIFTTTADGSRVDANIYAAKGDVYLDGGPGPGGPAQAGALVDGDYYFQVTDPSGKVLLSTDDIECRKFRMHGWVIVEAYSGPGECQHVTGIDQDHASLGAITIQLMPYADTPNPGGEYKVWAIPVRDTTGEFTQRFSKTDNFKVLAPPPPPPPSPCCGNGILETGEECDDGNTVSGDGCSSTCQIETPPPPPVCGNGILETGEECDDGNTVDGDGCSCDCKIEVPTC